MRTRTRRATGTPTAANMRRSWRRQPWASVTRYQVRPSGPRSVAPRSLAVSGARGVAQADQASETLVELGCQRAGLDLRCGQGTRQADRVLALDAEARMAQALAPVAVVGEQDEALGVAVEAADREEAAGSPAQVRRARAGRPSRSACRSLTVEVTPIGLSRAR